MNRRIWSQTGLSFAAGVLLSVAAEARADPCVARLPERAGQSFSGQVRYIVDGDGLCVGGAADPDTWIEVRLADFDAPELNANGGQRAKALLSRLASGRSVVCKAVRGRSGRVVVHNRVIAVCTRDGRRLGDLLREAGGVRGGNGATDKAGRCGVSPQKGSAETLRARPQGKAFPSHVAVFMQATDP